jgi:acetyl esterase/lipase
MHGGIMKKLVKTMAGMVAFSTFILSLLRFFRVTSPQGSQLVLPKMLASALAPYLAAAGTASAVVGAIAAAPVTVLTGASAAFLSLQHFKKVLAARGDWDAAFGTGWQERIHPNLAKHFLPARWNGKLPDPPATRVQRDVPFWTLHDDNRVLLCDIWQPPPDVPPSGLGLIYLHGSGWHFLDKDVGTRPMFGHLAAQGHVIMDVAYRLCPETDWRGMLDDAKRAVVWMKTNAADYGFDSKKVVLMGGSAGGQLALLSAFSADQAEMSPADAQWSDLEVSGVIAWYGPADMAAYNEHAGLIFGSLVQEPKPQQEPDFTSKFMKRMGFEMKPMLHWQPGEVMQSEMMRALFGCAPTPAQYREASPVAYTGPHCPPTLLLQGAHDAIVPPYATRSLAERLRAAGVPVVLVEYPETEHAFDLILPKLSPSSQAAMYETERFLGVLASRIL